MKWGAAVALLLATPAFAQSQQPTLDVPSTATLQIGTEVPLMLLDELSSKRTQKGASFHLEVSENVVANGVLVIPAGTQAVGEVTRSDPKGAFGKSGKLEARVLYMMLDDKPVRLSGTLNAHGKGATAETVLTAAAVGALAWIVTGKSAVLPKGAKLIALLDKPVTVSLSH